MYKLLVVVVVILVLGYLLFGKRIKEGMNVIEGLTSDEAIQNIASLYNKDQMTITNLDVTGKLTNPNLEETLTNLNKNIMAQLVRLDEKIDNNNNNIQSQINDLNKVIVLYPVKWDRTEWVNSIKGYFNRNMADGTLKRFLIVHPGDMNPNHPNRWITYVHGIKYGQQVIMSQMQPEHHNIPNPLNNTSSDRSWRGDI